MSLNNVAPDAANLGLCEECKPVETWIQNCIQGQQNTPTSFGLESDEIQLGFVHEIITRRDCRLCRFLARALDISFNPPLPLQYTTFTGTWDDSITIALENLTAKPNRFEVGFDIKIASLSAQGVNVHGGTALNDEDVTHEGYKFYPIVRLIASDAPQVPASSKPAIRLSRLINPNHCNTWEICQTYQACVKNHRGLCETPRNTSAPKDPEIFPPNPPPLHGFRVVDVKNKCVVKVPLACRYVALSYVWGKTPFLQTRLANIALLETPGILGSQHAIVPRTLWEAMSLTEMLGERFLWIDAL